MTGRGTVQRPMLRDGALRLLSMRSKFCPHPEEPAQPAVALEVKAGEGHGATEAPRGILYHRYRIGDDGLIAEAIAHALEAGDPAWAAHLVEQAAEATMLRSEFATLLRWMEALPEDLLRNVYLPPFLAHLTDEDALAEEIRELLLDCATKEKRYKKPERIAAAIGLAFQVADDILNEVGNPEIMGKAVGTDRLHRKNTYPALLGLSAARQKAADLVNQALRSLEIFDTKSDPLRAIARYVVERHR